MNFKSGPFVFDREVGIYKECFIIINISIINRCFIPLQNRGFVLNCMAT